MKQKSNKSRGFTLIELMVAIAIFGMASTVLYQFMISSHTTLFNSTHKLNINSEVRRFSGELSHYGRTASQFYIYPSTSETSSPVVEGHSGNFLFLVYQKPYNESASSFEGATSMDPLYIHRLVGFYTSSDADEAPVYKVEVNLTSPIRSDSADKSTLISNLFTSPSVELVELARGTADEDLFFFYRSNTVMINGVIIQGNDFKRISNTYNFSFSVRGS